MLKSPMTLAWLWTYALICGYMTYFAPSSGYNEEMQRQSVTMPEVFWFIQCLLGITLMIVWIVNYLLPEKEEDGDG